MVLNIPGSVTKVNSMSIFINDGILYLIQLNMYLTSHGPKSWKMSLLNK